METLQDAMANWPPTIGAGVTDSPITQTTDEIKRATVVEQKGISIVSLFLDGKRAASEVISGGRTDAVRRITPLLEGLTIEAAGQLPLDTDER